MDLVTCTLAVAIIMVVIFVAFSFLKGAVTINEGEAAIIERNGKYQAVLKPGFHFIIPFTDRVKAKVVLSEQHFDTGKLKLFTADPAPISFNMSVHYQIMRDRNSPYLTPIPDALYRAVYTVHDWQAQTKEAALATITEVIASRSIGPDIIQTSNWVQQVSEQVAEKLNKHTNRWGVNITEVHITDVDYSEVTMEISSNQGKVKREVAKKLIEADGQREVARRLGFTNEQMLRWRYIETLHDMLRSNPEARIMLTHDAMGGMSTSALAAQVNNIRAANAANATPLDTPSNAARLPEPSLDETQSGMMGTDETTQMLPNTVPAPSPAERNRTAMRDIRTRDEEIGR